MDGGDGGAPRRSRWRRIDVAATVVVATGVVLGVFAGAWYGWFPGGEGQLTLAGRSWHQVACGPRCNGSLLFNWAIAATVLAPFLVAASFLAATGRLVESPAARSGRSSGTAAILTGDLLGWAVSGAVFFAVGAAAAADRTNWNNFSSRYSFAEQVTGGPGTVFNWPWASAAAMVAVLASAIVHGRTSAGPRCAPGSKGLLRARLVLAASAGLAGVVLAYVAARAAGSDGTAFDRSPMSVELVGSRTNWLVFIPLAAGCVAAAVIRTVDLRAARPTGSPGTQARRLLVVATVVGLAGTGSAAGLARRFRLASHRLFDWSGTTAFQNRFNWTLFGLVAGPAIVAAATIALRAVLVDAAARRSARTAAALFVLAAVGVLLAALLARHVGSDQWRMSVLRGGDDGRPYFNRFVFLAASGPFVAIAGAGAAAWRAVRAARRTIPSAG